MIDQGGPVPCEQCDNHQTCQCWKHPCGGSWHRPMNWSGRNLCDACMRWDCDSQQSTMPAAEYKFRCETIPHGSCAWCRGEVTL